MQTNCDENTKDMPEHMSPQAILFFMLYGGAAVTAAILCLYMLMCKGNAISPDIMPPVRLRRWVAAFFGVAFVGHCYWFFFLAGYFDKHSIIYVFLSVLDCVMLTVTFSGTLLSMLQDRCRPVWPFAVATIPTVILGGLQMALPAVDFIFPIIVYTLSVYTLFTVYMAIAVMEYKRWLRDNYADLEHKEVWVSHTLLIVSLLLFVNYGFGSDEPSCFLVRLTDFGLFGFLLWRVETLPSLASDPCIGGEAGGEANRSEIKSEVLSNIGQLLEKHCVNTKLYLQHDLTSTQLSATIGINRYYLSQYFASQGQNYNAYINGLRINYFVRHYREAVCTGQSVTARQLAQESGYRSYSTFSSAFRQRMGQSVTAWIRGMAAE